MRILVKALALTVLLLIAGAACGDSDDNLVRPGVTETEDLPGDFPDGFSLPDGSTVVVSADLTGGVSLVLFEGQAPEGGFGAFFREQLPEDDWSLLSCTETEASPEPIPIIVAVRNRLQVNVTGGFLDVDYPIEYQGPYDFAVQYWETEAPAAVPTAVPESCR